MSSWNIYDNYPIERLGLNTRTYNALKGKGIHVVGQVMGKTLGELLDIRGFGVTSLGDVANEITELAEGNTLARRVQALEEKIAALEERVIEHDHV